MTSFLKTVCDLQRVKKKFDLCNQCNWTCIIFTLLYCVKFTSISVHSEEWREKKTFYVDGVLLANKVFYIHTLINDTLFSIKTEHVGVFCILQLLFFYYSYLAFTEI